jgi:ribonucleoside-triphosphate reductase
LSSGACGYPNLIPYLYYFWKKDKENNYLGISEWKRYAKQNIQELVYQWNQPITRDGLQSAFTNVPIFDSYYLEALFGGAEFPDGSFMVDELDEIMEFQKLFLETVEEIRGTNVMTYPVLSFSCLYDNGEFLDNDFVDWAIETDKEWMLCNWFGDSTVTSLSNCCRLKSDIEDLGYFNSIGSTALKVGSCKVSTINLARIALQSKSQDDFFVQLRDTCETNLKILDVQRSIIQRNVDKKLLPNFSCGEVDFDHLYSTVGILSPYETLRIFNLIEKDEFGNTFYTKEADKFVEKIYKVIHNTIDNFSLDKNYKINLEAIPGESAASKMMQADQLLFGDEVIDDLPLYANQYLPLGIQTTLQERIRVAGLYSKFCGGGDILHANVDAPFKDNKKMKDMIKYIFDKGVKYFAFTSKISACEDNHGFYGDICPKCGKPAKYSYARVVGFWTKMENWSENRRKEGSMRKWENINED